MNEIVFIVNPFLICIALLLIHTYFGLHILERGIIFVDIAMAQFIGIGIAISFLMSGKNHHKLALFFAFLASLILSFLKKFESFVNIEAIIGVLYVFSLSVTLMVLDRTPHGIEEFRNILNGNILWVNFNDVKNAFLLYFLIGLFHFLLREKFYSLTFKKEKNVFYEFLFFLTFGIVLVKSVVVAGILTVFSFLIIPALIGRLFSKKFITSLLIGYLSGLIATMISIMISYFYDYPSSPTIIAFMSLLFFLTLFISFFKGGRLLPE